MCALSRICIRVLKIKLATVQWLVVRVGVASLAAEVAVVFKEHLGDVRNGRNQLYDHMYKSAQRQSQYASIMTVRRTLHTMQLSDNILSSEIQNLFESRIPGCKKVASAAIEFGVLLPVAVLSEYVAHCPIRSAFFRPLPTFFSNPSPGYKKVAPAATECGAALVAHCPIQSEFLTSDTHFLLESHPGMQQGSIRGDQIPWCRFAVLSEYSEYCESNAGWHDQTHDAQSSVAQ